MLSVVTVTFNNFDELKSTLDSISNIPNIQSIIVNGGSCEKTLKFLQNHPGIAISERDKGISDAFNKGWHKASGLAVVFLNSGDLLIDKNYYHEAIQAIESGQYDFVYADMIFEDTYAGDLLVKSIDPLPCMPFNHQTLVVKKEIFEKVGDFDLDLKTAMDLDFVYRMLKLTKRGLYIQRPVVRMNGRGVSSTKYFKVYKEKCVVAIRNKDYSFRAAGILGKHFISLVGKKVLIALNLEVLLKKYRQIRYKLK